MTGAIFGIRRRFKSPSSGGHRHSPQRATIDAARSAQRTARPGRGRRLTLEDAICARVAAPFRASVTGLASTMTGRAGRLRDRQELSMRRCRAASNRAARDPNSLPIRSTAAEGWRRTRPSSERPHPRSSCRRRIASNRIFFDEQHSDFGRRALAAPRGRSKRWRSRRFARDHRCFHGLCSCRG